MDFSRQAVDKLLELSAVKSWPEMRIAIEKTAVKHPRDWNLPVLACEAVGGEIEQAIPAVAAIGCMQMSIILIDDLIDEDPRGEYQRIGEGSAANLAIALQAMGLEIICQSKVETNTKLDALHSLNQMMLKTALGQQLDIKKLEDESAYWNLVRTKSSPFFGTALHVGALLGGATSKIAFQIQKFGHLYGEMIQIHDDLKDSMETPANPDWVLGRTPLPILFAQVVDHSERERFLILRQAIPDLDALAEAQGILIRCGAVSFCIDQIIKKYQTAQKTLRSLSIANSEKLDVLMENVIEPVRSLFLEIGIKEPDAFMSLI